MTSATTLRLRPPRVPGEPHVRTVPLCRNDAVMSSPGDGERLRLVLLALLLERYSERSDSEPESESSSEK